ncbi:hypothetical protein J8995_27815 [Klebsiella quasipneumoniae subsp. quasipneumoniae]|uniref:hypothetical protein n=1 Tax=Klebsiella quasipneumoniae TaxID=1463165 RepID=UPI002F964A17
MMNLNTKILEVGNLKQSLNSSSSPKAADSSAKTTTTHLQNNFNKFAGYSQSSSSSAS